ncbi:MAG: TonB-dependent receptor family protein [Bacteroidota bacterium]
MKYSLILIVLSLLSLQVLFSQDPKPDTLEYKYPTEVVISASRMGIQLKNTPFSTSLVDSEALKNTARGVAVDEALKLVPGVKIDNQANGSRVHLSVRGQGILTERGIRGIKILLDELPINDPSGFAPDLYDIDWNTVDRIEVLKGPAASIYGSGGSGGIINILTKNAPNRPSFGEASLSTGSNNFYKGFGSFGGTTNDVNYDFSFSRTAGNGYRTHTRFHENNIYGKATYTPTDFLTLTPIFIWTDTYHENPEGLSWLQYQQDPIQPNGDAERFNEFLQTNRTTNGLTGSIRVQDNQEIHFNGYIRRTLFTEANNHYFDHQTLMTPGGSLQYSLSTGTPSDNLRNKISIGTDVQWQTIDESIYPNDFTVQIDSLAAKQQIQQRSTGVFLIDMINLGNNWSIMGNLRYDQVHNELNDLIKNPTDLSGNADFSRATGRIGATYTPSEDMSIYGSWGQGFLPPSISELGNNPDRLGGFNMHLAPATSNSYEAGVRGDLSNLLGYDLTGFYTATENDYNRYRLDRGNGDIGTFYENVGATHKYGIEAFVNYSPVKDVEVKLAYSYSHFTYSLTNAIKILMDPDPAFATPTSRDTNRFIRDGNYLPNSPQHQLMLDVAYHPLPDLSIGLSTETLSEAYIDGSNDVYVDLITGDQFGVKTPGYTLFGARIGYTWRVNGLATDAMFHVRNITDQKYVAFSEPDTGGNSYQPGTGREFFFDLKVHF